MNIRQRARRALVLVTALSVIFASGAFANDTQQVPVSVATVSGERALTVTGAGGDPLLPVGPASLAFGSAATQAPFGVVVTDVAYERTGYQVSATLSNLHRVGTGGFDCEAGHIPAGAFSVSYANMLAPSDVEALVDPLITFTDDIEDNLGTLGLGTLTLSTIVNTLTTTEVEVEVAGIVDQIATSLQLMDVAPGSTGDFTGAAAHPACPGSGDPVTTRALQTGSTVSPDMTSLRDDLFEQITGDLGATMDATDAISAGLLPEGTDSPGGDLYQATRTEILGLLGTLVSLLNSAQLDALVVSVVDDLVAEVSDLVLDLVGQSGVYANVPMLTLDRSQFSVPTGLYSGRMTVTLVDTP